MSKSVLISIQPKWCELIADGKKTVEVRKTRPKIETPFKCYIYESGGNTRVGNEIFNVRLKGKGRKKVIGEFSCDYISAFEYEDGGFLVKKDIATTLDELAKSCLTDEEFKWYAEENTVYGWHISNLVIYDEPRELSEFRAICRHYEDGLCGDCEYYDYANNESYWYEECAVDGLKSITRAPQSWCYVESDNVYDCAD